MHFTEIRLTNFGQFSGEHAIDLCPRASDDGMTDRPIVLIGGKNGAGKTTLLEAVKLCLYGRGALPAGAQQRTYEGYISRRIHRRFGAPLANTFAEVTVTFVHTIGSATHTYRVRRAWQHKGRGIDEALEIWCDDEALRTQEQSWWDKFMYDLLPPGLADLFFFDGEKIQALAEDSDQTVLGESIRALLGLELLDRLRADLNIYLSRQKRTGHSALQDELHALSSERQEIEGVFEEEYGSLGTLKRKLDYARGRVSAEEQILASEGGHILSRRKELERRTEDLHANLERIEGDITDQANGLLPFAVIPSLCSELANHLITEERVEQDAAIRMRADALARDILGVMMADDRWLQIAAVEPFHQPQLRHALEDVLTEATAAVLDGRGDHSVVLLHDISKHDRRELLVWMEAATTTTARSVRDLGQELEATVSELADIGASQLDMPADEAVQPILQRLADLHQDIGRLEAQIAIQETVVQNLRNKRAEAERREMDLYTRMMRGDDPTYRLKLVGGVQRALVKYEEVLRQAKLRELEQRIVECFGRLSRKGNYIRRVAIEAATFETTLYNSKDESIPKADLSAGEKQIYAVAVLWALRLVSGRSLPVIVDTPLGRLDSDHRRLLVQRYFPQASHQVILLSTDTEVDKNLYSDLTPAISHAYRLSYRSSDASTEVADGYFWQPPTPDEHEVVA